MTLSNSSGVATSQPSAQGQQVLLTSTSCNANMFRSKKPSRVAYNCNSAQLKPLHNTTLSPECFYCWLDTEFHVPRTSTAARAQRMQSNMVPHVAMHTRPTAPNSPIKSPVTREFNQHTVHKTHELLHALHMGCRIQLPCSTDMVQTVTCVACKLAWMCAAWVACILMPYHVISFHVCSIPLSAHHEMFTEQSCFIPALTDHDVSCP